MFLSYIIPPYWVASFAVARQLWLDLDYSPAISYRLGAFVLFKFGGVYCGGSYDALWAENGQVSSHEG